MANRDDKQKAVQLLQGARKDLEAGRIAEARRKAFEASTMNVAYSMFDDRPELVLAAISRAERRNATVNPLPTTTITPRPAAIDDLPPQLSDRRVAAVLLKQARQDIAAGRFDDARLGDE
ncbi:MAG: hypothetical protein IID34_15955, partial [Planctomycetes bacterium]|nr:hypothetical protein [Planctomycetota bacterium]